MATTHEHSADSSGWPIPRSVAMDSAAISSARRTPESDRDGPCILARQLYAGAAATFFYRACIAGGGRALDPTAHHVIYVATPTFGTRGLYLTIVHALGARPRAQKAELIAQA